MTIVEQLQYRASHPTEPIDNPTVTNEIVDEIISDIKDVEIEDLAPVCVALFKGALFNLLK